MAQDDFVRQEDSDILPIKRHLNDQFHEDLEAFERWINSVINRTYGEIIQGYTDD
jgi:hypothetical protein